MPMTSTGAEPAAANACMENRASTPASRAAATDRGMRFMTRSNQPVNPQTVMSAELTMKAPTASGMVNCPEAAAVASTTAPGVDQAIMTGLRSHSEGRMLQTAHPRQTAHIQEVISAGVAPKPCAARKMMATELVKPTRVATKPATNAVREKSRTNCSGDRRWVQCMTDVLQKAKSRLWQES